MLELNQKRSTHVSSIPRETSRHFDIALHQAARTSADSMTQLKECVTACVASLKGSGLGPVDMIITMKACAKESAQRFHPAGDEDPRSNVDLLMEQIVKWSIIEYYRDSA